MGVIVSLVECKSKLYLICKVLVKSVVDVVCVMVGMLWKYCSYVWIIMVDNGSEFCDYELVVEKFKMDIYFVNLYLFWECGLNENFNGLFC